MKRKILFFGKFVFNVLVILGFVFLIVRLIAR